MIDLQSTNRQSTTNDHYAQIANLCSMNYQLIFNIDLADHTQHPTAKYNHILQATNYLSRIIFFCSI